MSCIVFDYNKRCVQPCVCFRLTSRRALPTNEPAYGSDQTALPDLSRSLFASWDAFVKTFGARPLTTSHVKTLKLLLLQFCVFSFLPMQLQLFDRNKDGKLQLSEMAK